MRNKIALFSVSDFDGIDGFAKILIERGWEIIATKDAAVFLNKQEIKVQDVKDFVGIKEEFAFPPTLHPKMEAALTDNNYCDRVELVYDIPYTLEKGNDVGGHTLLALAAKGNRLPIVSKEDMRAVISIIRDKEEVPKEKKKELIAKANFCICKHYLSLMKPDEDGYDGLLGLQKYGLINGENPYQSPASVYEKCEEGADKLAITNFQRVSGEAPCFTNVADLDCILFTLCIAAMSFKRNFGKIPYISIAAKHGNPCGMAVSWTNPNESITHALFGNPLAIWGGEFITNFPITEEQARLLFESEKRKEIFGSANWMLDVIAAVDFDQKAVELLGKREQRKLFKNDSLLSPQLIKNKWAHREIRGGFLRQPQADYILEIDKLDWLFMKPEGCEADSIIIAWCVAFSSNHGGNEVAIANKGKLLAVGGGPSTLTASRAAIDRAKENLHEVSGSVFAADAFFPFTDVPETFVKAGCISGVVPAGGKNIKEVKTYFKDKKCNVGFIPEQYRGFCRH